MNNKAEPLRKEKGFTALELIIVLIVGFLIIAMSASRMGQLFSSSNTTAAASSVLGIYSAARAFQSGNGYGNDGDDLLSVLIDTGTFPAGLPISGSTAVNEWGNPIKVQVENNGQGFAITYSGVPTDACSKLAQQLLNSGTFSSVDIGGTAVTSASTLVSIVSACKSGNANGTDMVYHAKN